MPSPSKASNVTPPANIPAQVAHSGIRSRDDAFMVFLRAVESHWPAVHGRPGRRRPTDGRRGERRVSPAVGGLASG
jgi:hypothetical protein